MFTAHDQSRVTQLNWTADVFGKYQDTSDLRHFGSVAELS